MRRPLRALLCLGSLAALGTPVTAAQAAYAPPTAQLAQAAQTAQAATSTPDDLCWVTVARPSVDSKGAIRAIGARVGCTDKARMRVRLVHARRGPDRVLKSGSKIIANGELMLTTRCTDKPRSYYVVAFDGKGNKERSRLARLSCPTPKNTPRTTPTTPTTNGGTVGTTVENEVVRLTNQARQQNGCGPLTHDARLRAAAFGHSADMAARQRMSHISGDGRQFSDRIRAAGFTSFRAAAENIAQGQRSAAEVVQAWLKSPGHRANMLNCAFTHIGAGHHPNGPFWTQVFAQQ